MRIQGWGIQGLVLLVSLFSARWGLGEDSATLQELLARMKAMESKIQQQDKEIGSLKGQLQQANAVAAQRPVVDAAVDGALARTPAGQGFYHDPELHGRAIRIGGNLDISYQFNLNRPEKVDTESGLVPVNNVFRVFDRDESNDFALNQAKLYFDGTAQKSCEAGFRIDLNFGEDTVTKFGLTGEQVFTFNNLEQAYIDYIAPFGNGVRISAGRFVTPMGAEVIESQDNWNATRSFNFGLGIPFSHTGLRAEYQVFDNWSVAAYVVNGWDNTVDNNDDKGFMFSSKWTPLEWLTWSLCGHIGNEGARNEADTRYVLNSVLSFKPWEKWEFAAEVTYGQEEDQDNHVYRAFLNPNNGNTLPFPDLGPGDAVWMGVAGYAKWQFLPNWYVAGRGEFFNDRGGTRAGLVDGNGIGQKVDLYSLTATVAWDLSKPLQIRFEYRHDGATRAAFNDGSYNPVFDGVADPSRGGRVTQDTLMMQWLYRF